MADEVAPKGAMATATKAFATHHQKMLLIDYEIPTQAAGYVMGHNSVTDFWDTAEHHFRDIRRERIYDIEHVQLQKAAWKEGERYDSASPGYRLSPAQQATKERLVQSYMDKNSHVAKPYQDVSCRLHGPILHDLNQNFCQAWENSTEPPSLFLDTAWLIIPPVWFARKIGDWIHNKMDPDFITRRAKIPWEAFKLQNGQHNVQLLRTEPQHAEKSIKECYANLTRQIHHYIFIQNQYIQYTTWAEHLIECVGRLRSAGYLKPICVFILTSTPENNGMDRPTYDVASKVGRSEAMKVEHEEAIELARQGKGEQPITPTKLQKRGINVFMGSLWTCAQSDERLRTEDYEEIYIHAKVAIVDDAAFTIGSANLNVRSMALDSELNVLSEAQDVAFKLRCDLFSQCSGLAGPGQFGDISATFGQWQEKAASNFDFKSSGTKLSSELLPFYVDRKPGSPVI
ncbi:phospholipase D-like domain-containing protein [Janthinobacterium sp. RB2R34]|uniref:phospholipase D-like domain-containing protein n=1 Tax=Janthinobacterium sp. RB2R34 TaxID=3424193 RepID=UPI003F28E069